MQQPFTHAQVVQLYGAFMVAWSVLEGVVQAAIMKELGIDPVRAGIVTTSMQFRQRVSVLASLLRQAKRPNEAAIKMLCGLEKKAKRNMLVHGHIVVGVPGVLTFVKSSAREDAGLRLAKASFTAAQLQRHVLDLNAEVGKLQASLGVSDGDVQHMLDALLQASAKNAP